MHKAAGLGDIDGKHLAEARRLLQQALGQQFDGHRMGALGDADGDHLRTEHQNVAPLNGVLLIGGVQQRDPAVLRVVLEDIPGEQGLPAPGVREHPVDGDPVPDAGEGIPGEVEVGHGINDKGIVVVQVVGEIFPAIAPDLRLSDARHHLQDHVFGGHAGEIVGDHAGTLLTVDAGLTDIVQDELALHSLVGERLRRQVLQIDHLGAAVPKHLAELVVLLLGQLEIGDVVEEQPLDGVRHKVFQFLPRPMEQHPPERTNLRPHLDGGGVHWITSSIVKNCSHCRLAYDFQKGRGKCMQICNCRRQQAEEGEKQTAQSRTRREKTRKKAAGICRRLGKTG